MKQTIISFCCLVLLAAHGSFGDYFSGRAG